MELSIAGLSLLLDSKSGIRQLSGFDITGLSSQVGGQISKEGNTDLFPENVIEIKEEKKMEPFIQFALIAAKEAILDSGWHALNEIDSERTGVMIGSGIGGLDGIKKRWKTWKEVPEKSHLFLFPLV